MNALSGSRTSGPGGWRTPTVVLVCASAILFLALGTRQGFGLFLQPMCSALGWGRETFSAAIALQNLMWGLAQPFVGAIADRFGAGRVLVVGGLCYAAGLVLMAYSNTGPGARPVDRAPHRDRPERVQLRRRARRGRPARAAGAPHDRARHRGRRRLDRAVRDAAVLADPDLAVRLVQRAARARRLRVPDRPARRRARGPDDPSPRRRAGDRAGAAGGREPQGVLAADGQLPRLRLPDRSSSWSTCPLTWSTAAEPRSRG